MKEGSGPAEAAGAAAAGLPCAVGAVVGPRALPVGAEVAGLWGLRRCRQERRWARRGGRSAIRWSGSGIDQPGQDWPRAPGLASAGTGAGLGVGGSRGGVGCGAGLSLAGAGAGLAAGAGAGLAAGAGLLSAEPEQGWKPEPGCCRRSRSRIGSRSRTAVGGSRSRVGSRSRAAVGGSRGRIGCRSRGRIDHRSRGRIGRRAGTGLAAGAGLLSAGAGQGWKPEPGCCRREPEQDWKPEPGQDWAAGAGAGLESRSRAAVGGSRGRIGSGSRGRVGRRGRGGLAAGAGAGWQALYPRPGPACCLKAEKAAARVKRRMRRIRTCGISSFYLRQTCLTGF